MLLGYFVVGILGEEFWGDKNCGIVIVMLEIFVEMFLKDLVLIKVLIFLLMFVLILFVVLVVIFFKFGSYWKFVFLGGFWVCCMLFWNFFLEVFIWCWSLRLCFLKDFILFVFLMMWFKLLVWIVIGFIFFSVCVVSLYFFFFVFVWLVV